MTRKETSARKLWLRALREDWSSPVLVLLGILNAVTLLRAGNGAAAFAWFVASIAGVALFLKELRLVYRDEHLAVVVEMLAIERARLDRAIGRTS